MIGLYKHKIVDGSSSKLTGAIVSKENLSVNKLDIFQMRFFCKDESIDFNFKKFLFI